MRTNFLFAVFAAILLTSACSDGTSPRDPLVVPAQYDSVAWAANAADEIALINEITALLTETKRARTAGVVLAPALVEAKLQPIRRYLSAEHDLLITRIVNKTTSASGTLMDPMKAPSENGSGGVFVRYLFDEFGTDLTEQIEKTLFSVALHKAAIAALDTSIPTVRNVDRALALFGATPAFKNSGADKYCANYAARRDKNDGTGFYTTIRDAFKKARAAAAAGREYDVEYREAVSAIRVTWERSQMATAISYCYATVATLSATTVTDSARATGIHSFGEAVGFLWGWSSTVPSQRVITDAQLSDALTLMRAPAGGPWTFYEVWQTPATSLDELLTVTERLRAVYGFSYEEMLDFKQNWISVQGRQ